MSLRSDQQEDGESTSSSSEPKTDRYGFLLVNGDTNNDSDEPSPELVRHREMKWINLISQWDQVLEKKHSKIKAQCQKGIPASVRFKCWPLLCGATQRKQNNKDLYKTLESSPGQQNWIDVINRDTDRQFPFHAMFQSKDSPGQQGLLQVLKAYTQFRPDEGYCQAQGPVAAVLLMHMPMEEAFWCLVQISELYLPGYYSPLLEGVLFDAAILFGVLKRTCPAAYKHMQKQGVEPLMFATDWLMCLYTRHLPFNTLLRVWDLFFCNGVRVLFQVAVVLVRRCLGEARQRKECEGQMETLERLRSVRGRIQQDHADAFIQEVCSVPLSLADLQRQTEKELEKWRKERPSSTFDPRDRCHGYYTIWEKGKENEKTERQSANLRAPVMRSHSTLSPANLRKKWRKRGSKTETADWEGKGTTKQDSDEDEKRRRASVCGVAGELPAGTQREAPQKLSPRLQNEGNTTANKQRPTESETVTHGHDGVFTGDQDEAPVVAPALHTDGGDCGKETRPPASPKEADIPQETGKRQHPETREDEEEEKPPETPRDDQIWTHQPPDARENLEEETRGNERKQEVETGKPEEYNLPTVQLHITIQEEEVNIVQQEVGVEVNTDIEEEKEKENKTKSEEETETGCSKQEEEMQLGSTMEEVIYNCDIQEHEEKVQETNYKQEVEQEDKQEIKAKGSSTQKVHIQDAEEVIEYIEIQEENKPRANRSERLEETENREEQELEGNECQRETEIQLEKANSSEQEVETEDGDKPAKSVDEEEKKTQLRRPHLPEDLPTDEQPQGSKQITGVQPNLKTGNEDHPNVLQTPKDEKNAEERALSAQDKEEDHGKDHHQNNADVEKSEKQKKAQMCDAPEKETEESITGEEIRISDNLTVDQEESETSQETQDENTVTPEHKDPKQTSREPPQLDEKKGEAELEMKVANRVPLSSGANQHPQLRLRRSSSSYTSYPTILSEDTFKDPQQIIKRDSCPPTTEEEEGSTITQPKQPQLQSSKPKDPQKPEQKSDRPKRRGLFRRLRADTPSKSTIPKIIIQDFSESEEKLSSKERRRRRRMQERKEKEEEKERKRLEKELEKEKTRERKKPQTRGKSFQVLSRKHDDGDGVFSGGSPSSASQAGGRKRTAYSESYF